MQRKKGAEIIVDHLVKEGVPYLFGLCGHGDIGLMDAALDRRDDIPTVSVHNEQIAGFMADAYYRVSGQPVATFTSCGPGSVNIQMPIATAFFDSSAIFAITGNIPTQQFNQGPFQEFGHHFQADFVSAMRPYVKRSYQAPRADMLPEIMRRAYETMLAGKPGPVHLDVPFNVFVEEAEDTEEDPKDRRSVVPLRGQGDPAAIEKALDLIAGSERPLVLAGQGVTAAAAQPEILAFSELLNLPVATTPQGKGAIDEYHANSLGPVGRDGTYPANRASRGCDVLLALGTRFGDRGTSGWVPGATHNIPPTKVIHVDLDPAQIGKTYPTAVGIVGDAKLVLRQLIEAARGRNASPAPPAWRAQTSNWQSLWHEDLVTNAESDASPCHPDRILADIRRVVPDTSVVLSDIGAHHSWMVQQFRVKSSARLLQSGGFACMGFGVGGALGAQLAAPDRAVLAVVGDGGFLMHANAVITAVEYDLPVVWVVWNNCGYVSIRDLQKGFFGREFATRFRKAESGELHSVDMAMMARAMGADGVKIDRPQDFAPQLEAAFTNRRPTVLDVSIESEVSRNTSGAWDMPPLSGTPPNYDPDPFT